MRLLLLISCVSKKLFGNPGTSDHLKRHQPLQPAEQNLLLHPDPTAWLFALTEQSKTSHLDGMSHMNFVNPSAVSKPKRRNKKRDFQTLRVLGFKGLAMFVLTG